MRMLLRLHTPPTLLHSAAPPWLPAQVRRLRIQVRLRGASDERVDRELLEKEASRVLVAEGREAAAAARRLWLSRCPLAVLG